MEKEDINLEAALFTNFRIGKKFSDFSKEILYIDFSTDGTLLLAHDGETVKIYDI